MAYESATQFVSRANDMILSWKGEDFARDNCVDYNTTQKAYFLKVGGEAKRVGKAEIESFLETLRPSSGASLGELLSSNDTLELMSQGVSMKNKGNLLIGKAYYLHLNSDNPNYAAFAKDFLERFGVDMPSKPSLTKAGKVYERFVAAFQDEEGNLKEGAPSLEELANTSTSKLYTISAHVDEGHDVNQMVRDARTLEENELRKKYVEPSSKGDSGTWFALPKVRSDIFEDFETTRKEWGALVGGAEISNKQAVDALIILAKNLVKQQPEIMVSLYRELFEANGDELPEAPRRKDGKLNVKELQTYPKDLLTRMVEAGHITSDDMLRLTDDEMRSLGPGEFPEGE